MNIPKTLKKYLKSNILQQDKTLVIMFNTTRFDAVEHIPKYLEEKGKNAKGETIKVEKNNTEKKIV